MRFIASISVMLLSLPAHGHDGEPLADPWFPTRTKIVHALFDVANNLLDDTREEMTRQAQASPDGMEETKNADWFSNFLTFALEVAMMAA